MTSVAYQEEKFINTFATKEKRERYLSFLKGHKHRKKFLELLNHNFSYNSKRAEKLDNSYKSDEELESLIQKMRGNSTCHLLADGCELDGKEIKTSLAVKEFLGNYWGSVLIFENFAIYKPEDSEEMVLFK